MSEQLFVTMVPGAMSDAEDAGRDEESRLDEPLAEADAADCEVTATSCEVTATEREGKADESEASLREEIFETFKPDKTVMVIDPSDGMPVPADERPRGDLAMAHPFSRDTMVCLEDDRVFVELFTEELKERQGWRAVDRPKAGTYARSYIPESADAHAIARINLDVRSQYDEAGHLVGRRAFTPTEVEERWGVKFVLQADKWVPVRPIRERCKFYKRQNMANDDYPDPNEYGHHILFRNCTMRRSVGGAFMTLRDEAMYACDYRDPPDPATVEKYLDERDRNALSSVPELVRPFNLADTSG